MVAQALQQLIGAGPGLGQAPALRLDGDQYERRLHQVVGVPQALGQGDRVAGPRERGDQVPGGAFPAGQLRARAHAQLGKADLVAQLGQLLQQPELLGRPPLRVVGAGQDPLHLPPQSEIVVLRRLLKGFLQYGGRLGRLAQGGDRGEGPGEGAARRGLEGRGCHTELVAQV